VSEKELHLLGNSPSVVREGWVLTDHRVSSPGSHSEYQGCIRYVCWCRIVCLRNQCPASWFVDGRTVYAKKGCVSEELPANPLQ